MPFDRGGELAFTLRRRLLVVLAGAKLRQKAGFFHGAFEAAQSDFERLVFFHTYCRHEPPCVSSAPERSESGPSAEKGAYYINSACRIKAFRVSPMVVLGIETSCDETGVALFHDERGLLAHALHSQVDMHSQYGGVVPELASRDHIRRLLPLTQRVLSEARLTVDDLDAIAYTEGPGLAGALLVGASAARGLAYALEVPAL